MVIEHEDDLTTGPIGFTRDGRTLYWISSIGRDKAALLGHGLAERQAERAGRASQGRHQQRDRQSATRAWSRRSAREHLTLDWIPLDERIADDLEVPARRAAGRDRRRRPHARR